MKSNKFIVIVMALGILAGSFASNVFGSPLQGDGHAVAGRLDRSGRPSDDEAWDRQLNEGWTEFEQSGNARSYYVSSLQGDDTSNTGRSESSPFRTIARGYQEMRDDRGDWLLLKSGDRFDEAFPQWRKGGEAEDAVMLISTYGEGERPLIRSGNETAFRTHGADTINHLAIVGLEFVPHEYDHAGGAVGIFISCGGRNILIEDCYIHGFAGGVIFFDVDRRNELRDVKLRRSIITDSHSTGSHAQGMYSAYADDILVEECVFDHNGWLEDIRGAEPTVFNHNLYISNTCNRFTLRNCIITNASSHGVQARPGGEVMGNVFYNNPLSILVGGGTEPNSGGVDVLVRRNVVLHGGDIGGLPRGHAITVQNIRGGGILNNIIAFDASAERWGHAILIDGIGTHPDREVGVHHLNCDRNFIYDWRGGIKIKGDGRDDLSDIRLTENIIQNNVAEQGLIAHESPIDPQEFRYSENSYYSNRSPGQWFNIDRVNYDFSQWTHHSSDQDSEDTRTRTEDMDRTIGTYHEMIGGDSSVESFLQQLRTMRRGAWTKGYTAKMLREYFEEGYAPADPGGHGDL